LLKVVSLDVGGTLIDYYYFNYVWDEAIPQLYARKRGLVLDEAKEYVLREYDRIGSNDIRWYLPEYWFEYFRLNEDPIEVFRSHTDKIRFYPEVLLVLEKLSKKYVLITASGISSNYQEIVLKKIRPYFKHIFSSISDLQEVKKTAKFYEMICKALRIEPDAIIHVGDDFDSDFVAPRRIGIKSFLLDRKEEKRGEFVIKDLRELEDYLND